VSALVIEFVAGSRLVREVAITPRLPIVDNGPPGTFVEFSGGRRVSLPTDFVIAGDHASGAARVELAGVRFEGEQGGVLVFSRPQRRMTIEPAMVAAILVDGALVWPARHRLN